MIAGAETKSGSMSESPRLSGQRSALIVVECEQRLKDVSDKDERGRRCQVISVAKVQVGFVLIDVRVLVSTIWD